ncbi:acyl-CoA thioesterase II [Helicocarpus griseus UAMH5409]|uniref:Acyl-CoA thioesterase II n=1 Tax=Helicocarpus griseus UAMH5409 TaxID=1447875 RepID=A0A2B7XVI9_9EURO|nr:acyl-CoA thioesterase II [Helicocarpus griseus UAMH5409]
MEKLNTPIENAVALTALPAKGQDIFINTHPLWSFAGGRGVYGGSTVAQCLVAAQNTISTDYVVHSIQSCFLKPANPKLSIEYHVERTRDGNAFANRTIHARQAGGVICTAIVNFVRVRSGEGKGLRHAREMPVGLALPDKAPMDGKGEPGPFETRRGEVLNKRCDDDVSATKIRYWMRAKGTIRKEAGIQAHLAALAYMSDGYLLGAIMQVHDDPNRPFGIQTTFGASLSHTVYVHNVEAVRADQWLCSERQSPWAANERGLAIQRIWSIDGTLIATVIQEGILRIKEPAGKVKL